MIMMAVAIPEGFMVVPGWFVWLTIVAMMMASAMGTFAVYQQWSFKKFSPEGLVFRDARKNNLDVLMEHSANMRCRFKLGERVKIKKDMKSPNWYAGGDFKFIPEEKTKTVEHSVRGLPIVHFVPPLPSGINPMGVRAINQLAEQYPELSIDSDKREVAYMFLTLPEKEILNDRKYLIDENPNLWTRIKEIREEVAGNEEDGTEGMRITEGEMVFQNVADVVIAPETAASEANMQATIEANTRRDMLNHPGDLMAYGAMIMMILVGAGMAVYILSMVV